MYDGLTESQARAPGIAKIDACQDGRVIGKSSDGTPVASWWDEGGE